jgi:hypothetical protein
MRPTHAMRLLSLLLGVFVGSTLQSFGFVSHSPEGITASMIASCIEKYGKEHEEALPHAWGDFGKPLKDQIEERMRFSAPTKRYAFISPPISLTAPHDGELVAMNRSPIEDTTLSFSIFDLFIHGLRGPGRYLICRYPDGRCSYSWATEDYVQKAFATATARLPEPDNEPERTWVIEARRSIYLWRGICAGVALLLVLWWRHARRTASMAEHA